MSKFPRVLVTLFTMFAMTFLVGTAIGDSEDFFYGPGSFDEFERYDICRENPVVTDLREYGDYRVILSRANDHDCHMIDISKGERPLYHSEMVGGYFYFGVDDPDNRDNANPFIDVVDTDVPELVFSTWTGGMHCCYALHVFQLDEGFRRIASVGHGNFAPEFEDVDHDGEFEIKFRDDILAYIFSCFADSASGEVTLKYWSGKYRVWANAMLKPSPDLNSMSDQIEVWKKMFEENENQDGPPPEFTQIITDLFYTGNKDVALELIERVWPANISGKSEFVNEYQEMLSMSSYYRAFERQLQAQR